MLESRLTDEGIDAILDDPRLPGALLRHPRGAAASFNLFAYVMIRQALRQAGEADRGLADYVSAIVIHFGFRDRAHRIGSSDDEVYGALVQLCKDLDDPDARRRFLVQTHLGNYALWLSGIFRTTSNSAGGAAAVPTSSTTKRWAARIPTRLRPSSRRGARTRGLVRQ
jgi:hypothetical protein